MSTKKSVKTEEEVIDGVAKDAIIEDEIERFIPEPGQPIRLEDGTYVSIKPLKLKELFAAFKIITRGSAGAMASLNFGSLDSEDFGNTLVALLLYALPEAPEEFSEFIRIVCDPVAPNGKWKNNEELIAAENHLDEILLMSLEIGDAIDIITAVIAIESKDIQKLGKKLSNAIQIFTKMEIAKN